MKKYLMACLLFLSSLVSAQTVHTAGREVNNTYTGFNKFSFGIYTGSVTFSQLGGLIGQTNVVFISDGSPTAVCTGGGTGAWGFYLNGVWNCGSIGGGIANITTTVGTTSYPGNTCTASAITASMPGVASTSTFNFTPNADISGVTGWGANGGLVIEAWPTTNTLNYKICNQTGVTIAPSSSVTFNVSAK